MAKTTAEITGLVEVEDENMRLLASGFMRVGEAAKFLGVSRSKLYMMMDAGQLTYARFGKSRRIPVNALNEFASRSLVVAAV